jgi:hypothetical protein
MFIKLFSEVWCLVSEKAQVGNLRQLGTSWKLAPAGY